MTDLCLPIDEYAAELEPAALENDVRVPFDCPSEELLWIALLICGDAIKAQQAVVRVHRSPLPSNRVSSDWAAVSNIRATARIAVEEIRTSISKSARQYLIPSFSTNSLDPLNEEQINALHSIAVERVIVDLDPFARCVLALRGVLQHSIEDCSHLAQAGRDQVVAAYDHALGWLTYQKRNELFWSDIRYDVNVFPVHHDDSIFVNGYCKKAED